MERLRTCRMTRSEASTWRFAMMRHDFGVRGDSRRRASFRRSSSRVLNRLTSTEVSTTIFAAVAGLAIVANDVRRVPAADPLLLEFLERGERLPPGVSGARLADEGVPQRLKDQLAPGAALGLRGAVHLLQELVR